jgi:glycosyltransferase involved in cell wall biosynthesis
VHVAARAARRAGIPLRIAAKMREQAEHEYFSDTVRPLLGGDIEYVGEVGRTAKLELLGEATCLINPIAWAEPFGLVMAESLACGTPVVARPLGAAPEIVDDGITGFLRNDEEALVTALGKIDTLDRRACRRVAVERFSAARMVAEHVELYESIVRGNGRNDFGETAIPRHVRSVQRS